MKDGRPYPKFSSQAGLTLIELMIAVAILAVVSAGILGVFSMATSQNKQQGEFATRVTEYAQDKMEQLMALQYSDAQSDTTTMPWSSVTYSSGYAAWSSATSYSSGGNVNYNGTSYVSNISSNLNITPGTTTSPTGGTGLGGVPPWTQITYSSSYATWSSSTSYNSGDSVNYNSVSYVSNVASNENNTPGASQLYGGINPSSPVTGYVDYLDAYGSRPGTANYAGNFYIRVWQIQNNAAGVPYPGAPAGTVKIITVVATTLSTAGMGGLVPQSTLVSYKANF
jgi:prepilin-type N-terminal cleavage/methylation domain-containing protein